MIRLQVVGRLGKDATVNTVNGHNVINFTVAHTAKYKDSQGNNQERTTWIDCAYWVKSTAIAPYLTKGSEVYVEGDPSARGYSASDGTAKASLSVRIERVQLLGGHRGNVANTTPDPNPIEKQASDEEQFADDLPF